MKKIVLNGVWDIESKNKKYVLKGDVPGTDFGNLVKQGIIVSPLISGIEDEALKIAEEDFTFSRSFEITKEILSFNYVATFGQAEWYVFHFIFHDLLFSFSLLFYTSSGRFATTFPSRGRQCVTIYSPKGKAGTVFILPLRASRFYNRALQREEKYQ